MRIGILGPFQVRTDDGGTADIPGARLRALLTALALRPGHVVPKSTLVDWIWGASPPSDAANALQRLVSRLRKALPDGTVEGHPDGYRLAVEPDDVDAVRFEHLLSQARDAENPVRADLLRQALALWRGDALQDVGPPDDAARDAVTTRLERLRLTALEDRFDAEIGLGRGADTVTELTDLVAAHPVRERLAAALMRALAAAGRDNEALAVYQRTREALADALGADPSPELAALHVALLRGEAGPRTEPSRTNLRAELTSYIGKEADVAAVAALVTAHRLTTLTGPGGSGKTRLAAETARTLTDDRPGGIRLVELAAIGADGDVTQATLAALGLRDTLLGQTSPTEPVDRLVAAIRDRELLLILDNCEHVIEAAAALAHRLLGDCRGLRILATSREPLGITGEALWPVAPLALPGPDASATEIAAAPAIRLLWDRASAVRHGFTADPGTLATMARICQALDGMPLAIELAAARLRTMSVGQLATRLDDRFRLLTGGSRTALPRHRTLRAMVDWSWELLSDAERTVLRRLSVFAGGASLEAAEQVCSGDSVAPEQVLELLTSLTEKSLLVTTGDDAPRHRMLGTIKEYAAQRLAEAGETETIRRAHLDYYTVLTETADPHLRGAEQLTWLAVLAAEHDDISAAMRGALAAGEAQPAMRLAAGAGWYWWFSGHKTEGVELINAAAAMPGEVTDETRALVYGLVGMFASSGRADARDAAEWIHQTYTLRERSRRPHPLLALVVPLERILRRPGDFVTAWEPLLDNEDPWIRALARLHMGKSHVVLGDAGHEADTHLRAALTEFRAIGDRFGISFALTELADRIAVRGRFTEAGECYEQAIAVVTEVGSVEDVIRMRARQAQLHRLAGDPEAAAAAMAEAERQAAQVTWLESLVELAFAKADLARWDGDAEEARRQLTAAMTMLGDQARQPGIQVVNHHLLGCLADDLDEARRHHAAAYRAAAETGYAPTLAHVVVGIADLALRRDDPAQAVRLLTAATVLHGLRDRSDPDVDRVEAAARHRLDDTEFAEAVREGGTTPPDELVAVTLAS
ncbi:putative ATPase [Stackebrandtia albiflava]|uniref:Putative ATPase n=1 Tax=Stackebrandtia albiflava TaxID=406432 RepID=A0A562VC58_9ACTN|nr:BTAD domain-containing putative transcriptional regulator [Stackebrandtia albiflava]TWJ15473.1 putative ATPase [Stackebrandtia albiflava]